MNKLSRKEAEALVLELDDWELITEANVQKLRCIFVTKNYTQSVAFTNAVAALAEGENHHPLLIVEYGTVTVVWWTHTINGLHKNDFIMAAKTSSLFGSKV